MSKDFGDGTVRDTSLNGRLYYMYMDYSGFENLSARLGRQFATYSAGAMLMDGVTIDMHKLSRYVGLSASAGTEVQMSVNSDYATDRKPTAAVSLFLRNAGLNELDVSYMRKYDDNNVAREMLGLKASTSFAWGKPYLHAAYNYLTESFDTLTTGVDVYPSSRLSIKGEYYQTYPTFDTTSIYSVFAVDRYYEYLARASYDFNLRFNGFASFKRQVYEENDSANVMSAGGACRLSDKGNVNFTLDHRQGLGGWL